jgi:hypothetical protein
LSGVVTCMTRTPFKTPLWCDQGRHALKRDNQATSALRWVRQLDDRGRYEGVTAVCLACQAGVRAEPDSPIVLGLITGLDASWDEARSAVRDASASRP